MILTAAALFAAAMILAALGTMTVIARAERQRSFDDRRYALMETLPDALLIVDDQWRFTHVNERAEALLRRGAADLIGKRVDQILDPLASDIFPEMQRVRKTGLSVEFVQTFAYSGLAVEVRVQPSIGEVLVYLRDVTERRNAEKRLREGERRLRLLLQQVPAVVWTADLDMRVTAASGTTLEDFALRESDVVGHSVEAVFGTSERGRQDAVLGRILQGDSVRFETCRDERWLQHEVEPLRGNDGGIVGAIGAALDISEMKRSAEKLAAQARTDALTGLPNRLALEESLDATLARVETGGECLAVIFLDLDRFKVINDSLGHRAGDIVLRDVARRLNELLANRASVYRPGGDEFVILAAGLACARAAEAMTAEILDVFAKPFEFEDRELLVTASIGASVYPDNAALAEDLVKQADAAMYRAKDAGRKNVKFYNRAMHAQIIERMGLELDLRQALERREFFVVYQPIVALTSQEIVAAEALLRWEHPTLGLLAPERFIDIAEEGGAIVEITRWVLEQACEQTVAMRSLGLPEFRVAVNVSARDLAETDFQNCFAEILMRYGLKAGAIDIEVTEGVTVSDRAMNTLDLMQKGGTRVVVDDFGIGYSSLDYIRRLPVSVIKIDKSFIADVAHCAHDQAIIKAITTLADSLGIGMIAEGVETSAQREFLMSQGVPVAQGFYFSRPVSAAQFAQLLQVKKVDAIDPGSRRVVSLFR